MKSPHRPRIFGIGLNKTGTSSLHDALEILGYTSLHFAGPKRSVLMRRAIDEKKPMLSYLDAEYDAFSDTPVTSYFWLADVQYPGSKFILTVRSLKQWLDSRRRHVEKNRKRAADGAYQGKFLEVDLPGWEQEYRRHEALVRSYFADRPDDLLVLDVTAGKGWGPLCDFLGSPVPDRPFPWQNRYRPWRGPTGTTPKAKDTNRASEAPEEGRKYFFIKVMKTGGGTLLQQILANFPREEVYPFKEHDPDLKTANYDIEYLTGISRERRNAVRVFSGHFPLVAAELLGMDLTTMTILRDPVERTLSYLRHCKRHHEQHRDLRYEEIYEDQLYFSMFIENHQSKQFAFTVEDMPESYMSPLEVDSDRLDIAKANLERVNVIGLSERFDEMLRELRDRFGWAIAAVRDRNVAGGEMQAASPSFRRRIAEDNAADMEFYEYAWDLCGQRRAVSAV